MALSNAYDGQAINGNGTSPNVNGLINQLTDPTNSTEVADFDAFVAVFADSIDSLWAIRTRDVAMISNVDAYRLASKTFRDIAVPTLAGQLSEALDVSVHLDMRRVRAADVAPLSRGDR